MSIGNTSIYYLLSALTLNAFGLAFMIVVTAYLKNLYQSSALQMKKNFGINGGSTGMFTLILNIVNYYSDSSLAVS